MTDEEKANSRAARHGRRALQKQEDWVVNVYGEQAGGSKDFDAGRQEL
jgi:hypothetical protein